MLSPSNPDACSPLSTWAAGSSSGSSPESTGRANPLWSVDAQSTVVVEGGTHNPNAPPFEFLTRAFLPVVARMGPSATVTLERHGFVPYGNGRIEARIEPGAWQTLELHERGRLVRRGAQERPGRRVEPHEIGDAIERGRSGCERVEGSGVVHSLLLRALMIAQPTRDTRSEIRDPRYEIPPGAFG